VAAPNRPCPASSDGHWNSRSWNIFLACATRRVEYTTTLPASNFRARSRNHRTPAPPARSRLR
jgi:hypothetical protein